jgi:hypothetical protein
MEPNPGLSIPSIGTPLYHLEEKDQQFLLPNSPIIPAIQRQQQQNALVLPNQQISTSQNNVSAFKDSHLSICYQHQLWSSILHY